MKPKLNSYVYIYYNNCVCKYKVIAIGEDLFVCDSIYDITIIEDLRMPFKFNDYKIKWFDTFKSLKEKYWDIEFKKIADNYWEAK